MAHLVPVGHIEAEVGEHRFERNGIVMLAPFVSLGATFGYDNFGNRAVLTGVINAYATPTATSQYTNNRWMGTGATYDNAGDQTALPSRTFTYDAESRLVASTQPSTGAISYCYDGEGRRVMKTVGSASTTYVYDAQGQLAAEYGALTDTGTNYLTADHLGSTRLVTDSAGAVKKCYDYYPFGEDIAAGTGARPSCFANGVYPGNADALADKLTGKERDAETGLDYFGARYFSGPQGRFTSPDPKQFNSAFLSDPQKWNKYAYVLNNPLLYVDPDGQAEYSFAKTQEFINHVTSILTVKVAGGVGLQKGRAAMGLSLQGGGAIKVNVSVPVLQLNKPSVTVSAELGGKGSFEGIQGKAQFATEATLVKNGEISVSGFENKSGLGLTVPETGTKLGTGSTIALAGVTETIPLLGPAGVVVSAELNANKQEATSALQSFEPAITEIGQDLEKFLGLDILAGKTPQQGVPR